MVGVFIVFNASMLFFMVGGCLGVNCVSFESEIFMR